MTQYLAGVDVGTTGARCMIFDLAGNPAGGHYCDYGATYPRPGWVEQDPALLIARTMEACRGAIASAGIDARRIASIGFSAQRSVTCPVAADGSPVRPMFSWQDARTVEEVESLRRLISADDYYALNGLPLGTTWIITKILWMRAHEPSLFAKTARFVQNQDLVLRAFGADDYYTDLCCAVFYGVWDVRQATWNFALLEQLGLAPEMFGRPTPPGTQVGTIGAAVSEQTGFAPGTPLCVGAGDQNCGVLGMGAVRPGLATVTLGTAGLAIVATPQPLSGFGGMMITHHVVPGMWEVEGLSNAAAASLRWFRDVFAAREKEIAAAGGPDVYRQLDDLAATADVGSQGLLFLPFLATAATPRWNAQARAAFIGLSFAHGRAELTRAVMEGVVLEIRDMFEQWREAGIPVDRLRIGGGATRSALWNQIQADVYGRPVETVRVSESTSLGAALMGGLGAGVFASLSEGVAAMVHVADHIEPNEHHHRRYEELYQAYTQAYEGLATGGAFDSLARIQLRAR
ncbi:MAG: xylulose kinase [Planctomycetes bacterium]|nr:xylulose kinase [Planctomycetota bacterium]